MTGISLNQTQAGVKGGMFRKALGEVGFRVQGKTGEQVKTEMGWVVNQYRRSTVSPSTDALTLGIHQSFIQKSTVFHWDQIRQILNVLMD